MSQKTLQIDQEGYPMFDGLRVTDEEFGRELLSKFFVRDFLTYTRSGGEEVLVEAFDHPLVVRSVVKGEGTVWKFVMPYGFELPFDLRNLRQDTFDRFCGHFENGVAFVLSRAAQASLFSMLDDFSDDSITIAGQEIEVLSRYRNQEVVGSAQWWSERYSNNDSPWDLDGPTPLLKQALLQLKLPRQRVLVLGAGRGHDAVELARAGHVVTAVDFSEKAHKDFVAKYGTVKDLTYLVHDAFKLPPDFARNFDLVFDHTFFVAIDPARRREVVQVWKKALAPRGHLLAVFFVMDKYEGPAFGATEWELHELLRKDFDLLYWTRSKVSVPRRKNCELLVYAQKKS